MCNLYSVTKSQQAIREFTGAMRDRTGNLPPMPGIFPDYSAPIVRNQSEGRELTMARWGMPSPVFALNGKKSDPGVTNARNVTSPHWRRWLGIEPPQARVDIEAKPPKSGRLLRRSKRRCPRGVYWANHNAWIVENYGQRN